MNNTSRSPQSLPRARGSRQLAALLGTSLAIPLLAAPPAYAEGDFTPIPQANMSVVSSSSEDAENAATNVLDGNPDTFWHSQWKPTAVPPPHHVTVKIGDKPQDVARVRLTPRASSNGSGRIGAYELAASTDPQCAPASFTTAATGEFDGLIEKRALERAITLDSPVKATCLKVTYKTSWGGKGTDPQTSPAEKVASLAEFNVDTAGASAEQPNTPAPDPGVPLDKAPRITSGKLSVAVHPKFPQVLEYRKGASALKGNIGAPLTSVVIDEKAYKINVSEPVLTASQATYTITVPELEGVSFDAILSVKDDVLTWTLVNIKDPKSSLHRIRIPGLALTTVTGSEDGAESVASDISVDRGKSGDQFYRLKDVAPGTNATDPSFMALASNGTLAAGFDTNAVEDNTAGGEPQKRVQSDNSRYITQVISDAHGARASVSPGTFTVMGSTAHLGLGADAAPFIKVKITEDGNNDGAVDWQDAAIASRDIQQGIKGSDDVHKQVIKRIPFNIVSQASHPFLRTLDDTKRISLATDGLGQSVMLKGYQAEGHDSAHPDYAGHYNERAGGKKDFDTLVKEGGKWNATFGVHVNATESYSESHNFNEDLLKKPVTPGWGWMNQSYLIDGPKDLGSKAVLNRFQKFRDETDPNLTFLYMDVYYPNGWEGQRFSSELQKQGWSVSTEWASKMPLSSTWSHWANDEAYGGQTNKGISSQVLRFMNNADKDVWNPDPMLSNANVAEFEGWTGHKDGNAFFKNVWERNLPTKFLQRSDIMSWNKAGDKEGRIEFKNGTVVTSPVKSVSGTQIPTDRTITFDGATVYSQGSYLLPWNDGEARLYHYNPQGGSSTWALTKQWSSQKSLTAYRLTDQGRVEARTVPVVDGKVTLDAKAGEPYVLYPSSALPAAKSPDWGQSTAVTDPGFYSGTLKSWSPRGGAAITTDQYRNYLAKLGTQNSSISQKLHDPNNAKANLPRGTYSAWAWVEIDPHAHRNVTVSVSGVGVKPTQYQAGGIMKASTSITSSTAINATASDTKHGRYFQRIRVTFTNSGGPVTLTVKADRGEASVLIDDVRVVPFTPSKDPAPTKQTVMFEDFENVDTGYGPFVTGRGNIGGDARTQLAERHEPYSQKGWYGVNAQNKAVAGGKLTDNVLQGKWSLMANEETNGLILRTTSSSLPLKPGHRYRVSMKHQTAFADTYKLVVGRDVAGKDLSSTELETIPFPEARDTATLTHDFTADRCGESTWIGVRKVGGGRQANLTLDDLRIEDLGPARVQGACADLTIDSKTSSAQAGVPFEVTTTVTNREKTAIRHVTHALEAPKGWTVTRKSTDPQSGIVSPGHTSTTTWVVTSTDETPSGTLTARASYTTLNLQTPSLRAEKTMSGTKKGQVYLSDLRDHVTGTPENAWGPVEWDSANGESGEGDGGQISIAKTQYSKGIGVHAQSRVSFDISGQNAKTFTAVIGVDDEVGTRGTVRFSVLGDDGKVLYGPSQVMRGGEAGVPITVDVTGVKTLTLVVEDAGDGNGADHGNWANAMLSDSSEGSSPGTAQPNPAPSAPADKKPATEATR